MVGYLIQVLGEELEGFVKRKNQSKLKDNDEHSFDHYVGDIVLSALGR